MSGFALLSNFACETCGSPSIVLPEQLNDQAGITCSGCGSTLGTWGGLKMRARQIIMAEAKASPDATRHFSCDPI